MFTREQLLSIIPEPQKKRFVSIEQKKEKVIQNALQNYAEDCRREDVVAVYDTTITGSGKKGYLLAADGLYGYDFTTFKRHTDGVKKVPFQGLKSYYCFAESSAEKEKNHHLSKELYRFVYADGSSLVIYLSAVYGVEIIPVIEGILKLMDSDIVVEDSEPVQMECEAPSSDWEQDPDPDEQCPEEQIQQEIAEETETDINTDFIKEKGLSAEECVEQGRSFFFAQDYHEAAPLLSFAADEGIWDAYFLLGRMYAEGLGVKKNAQKARELFDKLQAGPAGKQYTISFGTYPQGECKEERPMRWVVLDRRGDELLLLSSAVIDAKKYHSELSEITWEKCDLRKWLNKEFLQKAFSEYEQNILVQKHELENPDNEDYQTRGGHLTEDKVFLLSIPEAQRYFNSETPERKEFGAATGLGDTDGTYIYHTKSRFAHAFHTRYAREQGVNTDFTGIPFTDFTGSAWWWLRSPGINGKNAAFIDSAYNFIRVNGINVNDAEGGVRPALWLKLES